MDVKELRIGNLIYVTCLNSNMLELSEKSIEESNYHHVTDLSRGNKDWKYEPIPLTEQWLIDFGFRHWRDEVYKKFTLKLYANHQHRYSLTIHHIKKTNVLSYYLHVNYDREIELIYVHTLQNLYFALTGEELKKS